MDHVETACQSLDDCHSSCPFGYRTNEIGCQICECIEKEEEEVRKENAVQEYNVTKTTPIEITSGNGERRSEEEWKKEVVTEVPTATVPKVCEVQGKGKTLMLWTQ